jgi:predicted nucleic acid-binding protein
VKQRIYIDTSVFGGYFDEEFKEHTIPLFDRIKEGEFIILHSIVTQDELENAPRKVKELEWPIRSEIALYSTGFYQILSHFT